MTEQLSSKPVQKLVDFENPLIKTLLAQNINIQESSLKYFVMPADGDTITLGNVLYKIVYARSNPFRFSAVPIGVLTNTELEQKLKGVNDAPKG